MNMPNTLGRGGMGDVTGRGQDRSGAGEEEGQGRMTQATNQMWRW